MTLIEFHAMLGETIMYCQTIENDLKWIYSFMKKGKVEDNFDSIDGRTLGQVLKQLKELDRSDSKQYISSSDYNFLSQMTEKRNFWCHQAYTEFVYIEDFYNSKEYNNICSKLIRDHDKLAIVSKSVENVRLQALKDYR